MGFHTGKHGKVYNDDKPSKGSHGSSPGNHDGSSSHTRDIEYLTWDYDHIELSTSNGKKYIRVSDQSNAKHAGGFVIAEIDYSDSLADAIFKKYPKSNKIEFENSYVFRNDFYGGK